MACCSSKSPAKGDPAMDSAARDRSKNVDKAITQAVAKEALVNKLLLLGAGESGKSTLFKQMIAIYGKGFPQEDRIAFVPMIHNNIISSMKTLCELADTFGGEVSKKCAKSKAYVMDELKGDEQIDAKLAAHLRLLWDEDPSIRATYDARSNFQLSDSTEYFFGRLDDVSRPDYVPTQDDILRCRIRTTGIVENDFNIEGVQFKLYDVGGQRNERKKWMHCFEGVTAVMFVTAISEYDQVLFEDESVNRMEESLNLFANVCNMAWFKQTSIILFLNKSDLFAQKILKVPLSNFFPDYDGPNEYGPASKFLEKKYCDKNKIPTRRIYSHITCATNTDNIAFVFKSVTDIIVNMSLEAAGMGQMQ